MKNWINLHNHTIGSMLDGLSKVDTYAERAKQLGMPAAAVTDHGNLHVWLEFYDACKKSDIKPILGLEAYQARKTRFDRDEEERSGPSKNEWDQRGPYHLIVLAKDLSGYKNLIKLSSRSYLEGFYVKPRIDHDLISEHSEGLIVLSGCLGGEVQQALLRGDYEAALKAAATMQEIVGRENYFIEIQDHGLEEQARVKGPLLEIAQTIGAKVVATGDCHYTHRHEWEAHDAMLCVQTKATVDMEERFKFRPEEFYLKSFDEMRERFEEEWLTNSLDIAEMVDVDLKFGEIYFPKFPLPEGETNKDEYFERLVWAGIRDRYGESIPQEVRERTTHELGVVRRMGFVDYFLVVSDLVGWAKDNGIRVGWGRGSAAGSILSFALRITNLDPLKFGLMFERFLVEGRKSMPDIDLDFDDRYRDKVIDYARQKYGSDHVAHIATFSRVMALSAIRDSSRVLGYEYSKGDSISKIFPPAILGVTKTIDQALAKTPELKKVYQEDKEIRHIIDTARGIEGCLRQPGIHAAGVVISQLPTMEFVPLMLGGENKDILVTQWPMDDIERCGQLKIDFLGLRNLGVIDMCVKNVKKMRDVDIDIHEIPLDDAETYEQLKRGNAMGVFQLESGGMKSMMMGLQPNDIYDVMALISLFRPGPLGSGMDKMFINRKHGREKVSYPHSALKQALDPSYGVMLYQEDVLNVVKILAGFSIPDADDLRKILGKKLMDKIEEVREPFVKGCKELNDVDERTSNKIYDDIVYFGGYGFNRAHAASYAMVSYTTAYLKVHYPSEYMAGLLSSVTDDKDKLAQYLNEARRMGLEVLGPSVIRSEAQFTIQEGGELLFGLGAIDGVGPAIVSAILNNRDRECNSLLQYLRACDPAILNKKIIEHLSGAGAFDDLLSEVHLQRFDRATKLEVLEREKKELGIYVTDHPLLEVWDFIQGSVTCSASEIETKSHSDTVKLGGIISACTKKVTKRGFKMYNLIFEDLSGTVEVVLFPQQADKLTDEQLAVGTVGILEGSIMVEGDAEFPEHKLSFRSFDALNVSDIKGSRPIMLKGKTKLTIEQIKRIRDIIDKVNGDSIVYFQYPEKNHTVTLRFKETTSLEVEEMLQTIVTVSSYGNNF